MVSLSSTGALVAALGHARRVVVGAYVLWPGRVVGALCSAARRGAHVTVHVDAHPFQNDRGARENAIVVAELRAAGVDAALDDAPNALHLKGAVVDGVAYLDDRNWLYAGNDTVVRDDAASDVRAVRDAICHPERSAAGAKSKDSDRLAIDKADALAREAQLLRSARAGEDVIVETESFGFCRRIYPALADLAREGCHVRLLVDGRVARENARERIALQKLRSLGVQIREGDNDEKFAVVGRHGWIGSANATYGQDAQRDWGLTTDNRAILHHLRTAFTRGLASSGPIPASNAEADDKPNLVGLY